MTIEQVAKFLQIDVSTLRRWTRRREIPAINIGTDKRPLWRYDRKALDKWLKDRSR